MRLIRSMARNYGYDARHVGIMGFSAGGHLAGIIETTYNKQYYTPIDGADNHSARPEFVVLLYPVMTMLPPYDHTHSEKVLLGRDATPAQQKALSVEKLVTPSTPPTFLAQAEDDPISNIANSKMMYQALQDNHIPADIHLFPTGGHGWGMGAPGTPEQQWPQLFLTWLQKTFAGQVNKSQTNP